MMNETKGKRRHPEGEENTKLLFKKLQESQGKLSVKKILEILSGSGINIKDPRIKKNILQEEHSSEDAKFDEEEFAQMLTGPGGSLIVKALKKELVIPDFSGFKKDIEEIFNATKDNTTGKPDESIPHPGTQDVPAFAVSICTVDGQLLQLGDHDLNFSIQSICKPFNYAIAREEVGSETLHDHVGVEPGGEDFHTGMVLNDRNLPHNPLINSGAIMTATFIKPNVEMEHRLEHVMKVWEKSMGDKKVSYKEEDYEAERRTADKNFALAHLMKDRGAFPEGTDLTTAVEFYLKCCAIEVDIDDLAHAAATLAHFGVCPQTGTKVFEHDTVKHTLSLMLSSGMYQHSGDFAFWVGLPAKSGISGGMMVVVPNLLGIAIYSPPLDTNGNSVRGVEFCEKLVEKFNFHKFDAVGTPIHGKKDPRKSSVKKNF